MTYARTPYDRSNATFAGQPVFTRPIFSAANSAWVEPTPVNALIGLASIFGPAQFVASQTNTARIAMPAILGSVVQMVTVPPAAKVSAPSPLGAVACLLQHDFDVAIDPDAPESYVCDLVVPTGTVRVPIKSWQATLQAVEQSYLNCVVPSAQDYEDAITEATEFVIKRVGTTYSGDRIEYEMMRSPAQTLTLAQGPINFTATLSGYFDPTVTSSLASARSLSKARSIFTYNSGVRIRCAIDWFLRPGMWATYLNYGFTVSSITYYIGQGDAYMDVNE